MEKIQKKAQNGPIVVPVIIFSADNFKTLEKNYVHSLKMKSLMVLQLKSSNFCLISSSSSTPLRFKFPAKSPEKVKLRPKFCFSPISGNGDSGEISDWVSNRRRILFGISTVPALLLQLQGSIESFDAKATQLDTYNVMKGEVRKVVSKGKAAGVLRLVFHDAGTFEMNDDSGGMNGSIVFELDRPENTSLKKSLKIVEKAKKEVDARQPVSMADMIAVAGAEAVSICGGPSIPVALGRLDSMEPDAEGKLPKESLNASGLKQCFQQKGFSTQELVALSGAHTLGSKGFGSPTLFDNSYYKILLEKPWISSAGMSSMIGLPSDRALVEDNECLRWIKKYADDEDMFFEDFKNAYIKLVNSGAKWKAL